MSRVLDTGEREIVGVLAATGEKVLIARVHFDRGKWGNDEASWKNSILYPFFGETDWIGAFGVILHKPAFAVIKIQQPIHDAHLEMKPTGMWK